MKIYTQKELEDILKLHKMWLLGKEKGKRADLESANLESADLRSANLRSANLESADLGYANLRYANLRSANLRSANLRSANLESADLRSANLRYANLRSANLEFANLRYANLRYANLRSADLRSADLRSANLGSADLESADLRSANLRYANLRYANLRSANLEFANLEFANLESAKNISNLHKYFQNCPEQGDFIGWKKVRGGFVLKLLVKGKRVSPYAGRKCRTNRAKVLAAFCNEGKKTDQKEFTSKHDSGFVYKIGRIVKVTDYDPSPLVECSKGIHFFITKQEAIDW